MKKLKYKTVLWLIVCGPLALVVLISIWVLRFGLAARLGVNEADSRLEILKSLWEFLLVAVFGGAVGLVFKYREGEVERRAALRESLLRTRADLVKAYNQAKAIRRLLRGLALRRVDERMVVRRDEYNSLMRELITAQLEFEYYEELIESDKLRFPKPDDLKAQISTIEKYLNGIVSEFEKAGKVFAGNDEAPLEKSTFPRLEEFVQELGRKSEEHPSFVTHFKEPFHEALKLIKSTADEPGGHAPYPPPVRRPEL